MRFRALCCYLLPAPLWAATVVIQPQSCIVTNADEPCQLQLEIAATQDVDHASCVYRSDTNQALLCVERLQSNQPLHLQLQVTAPIDIDIRTNDGTTLVKQPIDYAVYKPVTTRRRRGLGWNLL